MNETKEPKQTVLTKEQWSAQQFAAHLLGDDVGPEDRPTKCEPGQVTVLNPFELREVSDTIIEGRAKPHTKNDSFPKR